MDWLRGHSFQLGTAAASSQGPAADKPHSSAWPLLGRDDIPWLAAAILTAIGLRILWVAYVNVDPNDGRFTDSVFFHNVAHALASGVGYADPWGRVLPNQWPPGDLWNRGLTAQWPPGYPAALAVLYKLFGFHVVLAKALNIAFAAVTVCLTYVTARRIFERRVAYLGALILAFFPAQIYFSTLVLTETMFAMVFMLVLLLALVWTVEGSDARWWQVLLIGLVVGIAGMVRAEGVFLVFVMVALWALTLRPWRQVIRYTAILALGTSLALTPWTVRNAVQFHEFIPLRTNAIGALAHALNPDADDAFQRREDPRVSVGEGFRHHISHPWQIPAVVSRRVAHLYEDDSGSIRFILSEPLETGPRDYEPVLTDREATLWRGLADRYFFAAGAAALLGAVFCVIRRQRTYLVLITAAAGWTLLFGLITPTSRYHFPLGPVIAILAAAFLVLVWDWAKVGWRRLEMQPKRARTASADVALRPVRGAGAALDEAVRERRP